MAEAEGNNREKQLIRIDIASDTVCPWCFVGKRNLDKAMEFVKDRFDFEVRWHPFMINVNAPKEGIGKKEYYEQRFGMQPTQMFARMKKVFKEMELEYDTAGMTGNSLDSHRLMYLARKQGIDKQHKLVDEIYFGYFCQGEFIGDRKFLLRCARKAGIEGAAEFLDDPNNGLNEVNKEFEEYSSPAKKVTALPSYWINGKVKISGGQPPRIFLKAFKTAITDGA